MVVFRLLLTSFSEFIAILSKWREFAETQLGTIPLFWIMINEFIQEFENTSSFIEIELPPSKQFGLSVEKEIIETQTR